MLTRGAVLHAVQTKELIATILKGQMMTYICTVVGGQKVNNNKCRDSIVSNWG